MKEDLNELATFVLGSYKATNNEAFKYIFDCIIKLIHADPIDKEDDIKNMLLSNLLAKYYNKRNSNYFSTRTINCLKCIDVNTFQDLINKTEYDLRITPNLGKKSLIEIKEILEEVGLTLKRK